MLSSKTPGQKFRSRGFEPNHPLLIVPGLCSSCLKVVKTPYKEWEDRRIWLDITTIGFGKVWDVVGLKKRKKKGGAKGSPAPSPVPFQGGVDDEEDVATLTDLDEGAKRRWISHMVLEPDGVSDPPGIQLRALEGIRGVMYLDPGAITNSLSYVFGPFVETLWDIGYTDTNLRAVPYDWRLPPHMLEERDGYFTKMRETIEDMVAKNDGKKVVVAGHSLGTRVVHFFLRMMEGTLGRDWASQHVHTFVAIGPLFLGAPKSVRATTSGERMGLEAFLFEDEGVALSRLVGSGPWMFPFITDDFDIEGYVYRQDAGGAWKAQSIEQTLRESEIGHIWEMYDDYYLQNPYFGSQEAMLAPPPVDHLLAIYGVDLKTEAFYFYRDAEPGALTRLALDPAGDLENYVCRGGIAYETRDTVQVKLLGKRRGGDSTVPYPSLSHCTHWADAIDVTVEELPGAEHREILKDKSFTRVMVEFVCHAPPPPQLPESFNTLKYAVKEVQGGKAAERQLAFTRKGVEAYTKGGSLLYRRRYHQLSKLGFQYEKHTFTLEFLNVPRPFCYWAEKAQQIFSELQVRIKFIQYSRPSSEEPRDERGQTELHRAAADGDVSLVRQLLADDCDANAQDMNDWTPLHCAAHNGHLDVAATLLKHSGTNAGLLTKDTTSALHYLVRATDEGVEDVWALALAAGVDINIPSGKGETPLHEAVVRGNALAVRWLIARFANVNAQNQRRKTALHYAALQNNREILALLLENGADKHLTDADGNTALALAQKVSPELLQFIRDFKPLGYRARAMYAYTAETPEELSMREGDVVNDIKKVDTYGDGWWLGECNGARGYFPSNYVRVREVIADDSRPPPGAPEPEDGPGDARDEYGQTALHKAAFEDRCEDVFQLLLGGRCNINAVDRNGWTPLHCAASKGNVEVVLLLQHQAGLQQGRQSTDGTTALHYLVRHRPEAADARAKATQALDCFLREVPVDVLGKSGETPLHQAAMRNALFAARYLLAHGADANARSDTNVTPLFYAAAGNFPEMAELLLQHGADPSIRGKRGTSLDAALAVSPSLHRRLQDCNVSVRTEAPAIPALPPTRKPSAGTSVLVRAASSGAISRPRPLRGLAPGVRGLSPQQSRIGQSFSYEADDVDDEDDFVDAPELLLDAAPAAGGGGGEEALAQVLATAFGGEEQLFEEAVYRFLLQRVHGGSPARMQAAVNFALKTVGGDSATPAPLVPQPSSAPAKGKKKSKFRIGRK